MERKWVWVSLFFSLLALFIVTPSSYATTFDLIPPTGNLQRGQNITFTINIDSQGASVTSIQSGLTYDATLLQYVSVTPGAAMDTVVADTTTYGTGKVLFTGTSNAGYNGTGVFATVVFTIIAQSSGSTEICTLWIPNTPAPSPTAAPSPTIGPSPTPGPTLPPQPTTLPVTGSAQSRNTATAIAVLFLFMTGGIFYLSQKQKYISTDPSSGKHTVKSQTHQKNKV